MSGMSRRNVLSLAAAGAATVAADSLFGVSPVAAFDHHHKKAGFELPPLPYAYDALQKSIDEQTMHIHHDKHHQGYVNKLNAAVEGMPELQKHSVEDLLRNIDQVPKKIRQDVINNGGGHANHTLFWEVMGPNGAASQPANWDRRSRSSSSRSPISAMSSLPMPAASSGAAGAG